MCNRKSYPACDLTLFEEHQMWKCKCDCVLTFLPDCRRNGSDVHRDPDDFVMFQRNQELLGEEAKECGVPVSLEWPGMENEARGSRGVTYVLHRFRNVNVLPVPFSSSPPSGAFS